LIRSGTFFSNRIGHYAADAGREFLKYNNNIDLYWIDNKTCNSQWTKMVKRNLPVYWWVKYIDLWNKFIPGGEEHIRTLDGTTGNRDTGGILEGSQIGMMDFLPEEEEMAKNWLRRQGWSDGEKFVCLLVRDSEYLKTEEWSSNYNWDYHNYRDSEINTYLPAMTWLVENDIWVFRMGRCMKRPLKSKSNKVIDYAFSNDKSDLLDIWLFANCNLCISTLTGLDMVSDVYRRPLLAINFLPLIDMYSWSNSINHPKNLIWKNTKQPLTLREVLKHQYNNGAYYEQYGIEIVDLTEDEIKSTVQECWRRIEGSHIESEERMEEQNLFWKILMSTENFSKYHGYIHKDTRISIEFLSKNLDFLNMS
jgi:putative glycosyltransferase (TIGR04372 family)